jgi:hypothetical protein
MLGLRVGDCIGINRRRRIGDPAALGLGAIPDSEHRGRHAQTGKLALQEPRLTQESLSSTEPRSPRLRNPEQLRRGERCQKCPSALGGRFWTPIGGHEPIDRSEVGSARGTRARKAYPPSFFAPILALPGIYVWLRKPVFSAICAPAPRIVIWTRAMDNGSCCSQLRRM